MCCKQAGEPLQGSREANMTVIHLERITLATVLRIEYRGPLRRKLFVMEVLEKPCLSA